MARPTPIPSDKQRADFKALRHRGYKLTASARTVLERAILYQDVSRDQWAARIIAATPMDEDPIEHVKTELIEILRLRNGWARWEERWIREGIANERAALGGPTLSERQAEIDARMRARLEADEEWQFDSRRMG